MGYEILDMKKLIVLIFVLFLCKLCAIAQTINVAFTIDKNYPIFTCLAINSIVKNSSEDFKFYIIESDLSNQDKKMMRNFVSKRNQQIEFININTDNIDFGKKLFGRITPIAIARIAIPDLLPNDVHRVIYLDSDILVTGDLKNLYNTDLKNYSVAMGLDNSYGHDGYFMFKKKDGYYNSGVILMDLDKLRKDKASEKMQTFLHDNIKKFILDESHEKYYRYSDQDLINIVLSGKIKTLSKNWNNQSVHLFIMAPLTDSGIIHFIGPDKPWDFNNKSKLAKGNKEYMKNWMSTELWPYKFLYVLKSYKEKFYKEKSFIKRKICRYKEFLKKISNLRKEQINGKI